MLVESNLIQLHVRRKQVCLWFKVLLTKHLELVLRTDLWTGLDTVVTSSVDYRRVDKLSKPAEYH